VRGTSNNCGTGSNLDPSDHIDHGTNVVSVVSANEYGGSANRGVTGILVDSFRIDDAGGASADAAHRAFLAAVQGGDKVINLSVYWSDSEDGAVAGFAEEAFNAGSAVFACVGNTGPAFYTAKAPGNARKVMAVGAIDVSTGIIDGASSRGPTNDGRSKPDVVAPEYVTVADNGGDGWWVAMFGGCSAATPHASGAAGLLRNMLASGGATIDPGQLYAHVLATSNQGTLSYDNIYGAGPVQLRPLAERTSYGKLSVTQGSQIDNTIQVARYRTIRIAIWWPELKDRHNDVDVSLVNPSGSVVASSNAGPGVFEKIRYSNGSTSGAWKVRVNGYSVSGAQNVYWAAWY
jgi:serine protease AprX